MLRRIFAAGILLLAAACATAPAGPAPVAERSITLDRTRCFGFCPDYAVTVHSDGRVVYDGRNFVGVTGRQTDTAAPEDVARLFALIDRANLYALRSEYRAHVTDMPSATLTLTEGDRSKSVLDYHGQAVGMPAIVTQIQEEVDRVARTARWTTRTEGGAPRPSK